MKRQDILVVPEVIDNRKVLIEHDLGQEATGIFLDYSIRFYKKSLDQLICSWNKDDKRKIRSESFDFTVIDNGKESDYLLLTVPKNSGNNPKDYGFDSGIFVVYSKEYFELVSKRDLNDYLKNYGYDFEYTEGMIIDRTPITKVKNKGLN